MTQNFEKQLDIVSSFIEIT